MKILFVADGRSPISKNWIRYFVERGDDVYLASTFDCDVDFPLKRLEFMPVAFSEIKKKTSLPVSGSPRVLRLGSHRPDALSGAQALGLRTLVRQWAGPVTISRSAQKLRAFIEEVQPDIIHAMRIPYEGMLAASALSGGFGAQSPRFIVSIWGNDFTFHAPSTPLMGYYTRKTMNTVHALHADCERDVHQPFAVRVHGLPRCHICNTNLNIVLKLLSTM
jgi:hypothetical protein